MKSIDEALTISLKKIDDYIDSCKLEGAPISDLQALLLNHNPADYLLSFFTKNSNPKRYSGQTGLQKALSFKRNFSAKSSIFFNSQSIINYLINNIDSKGNFHDFIWEAIREIAGFTQEKIGYLSIQYAKIYNVSSQIADQAAIRIIDNAIQGIYSQEMLPCFGDEIESEQLIDEKYKKELLFSPEASFQCEDYGNLLLHALSLLEQKHKIQIENL